MTNEQRWAERVLAWRASGLTSAEFSAGREFTAGGLRHWAYLLKRRARSAAAAPSAARPAPTVRIARVQRLASSPPPQAPPPPLAPASASWPAALMIELGGTRVSVPAGFDVPTLQVVLSALTARVGGGDQ